MTNQVNQEFEKWFKNNTQGLAYPNNEPAILVKHIAKYGWQAATKVSEQRITELQELLNDRQSDLDFEFNRAEQNELECNALTEDNIQLREALEDMLSGWEYIRETYGDLYGVGWDRAQNKANQAISSTTKQSLAEHDNDVIERIATALENADGELKTLPEYVALVRKMKHE